MGETIGDRSFHPTRPMGHGFDAVVVPIRSSRRAIASFFFALSSGVMAGTVSRCFPRNHVNPLQWRHGFVRY